MIKINRGHKRPTVCSERLENYCLYFKGLILIYVRTKLSSVFIPEITFDKFCVFRYPAATINYNSFPSRK